MSPSTYRAHNIHQHVQIHDICRQKTMNTDWNAPWGHLTAITMAADVNLYSSSRFLRTFLGWLQWNQDASKGQAEPRSWCLGNERGFRQQFWRQWYSWPSPPMQPWRASCKPTKTQEGVPEAQTLQLDGAQWNNQPCRGRRRVDIPGRCRNHSHWQDTAVLLVNFSLHVSLK